MGRPKKYANKEDLENKINSYFDWCDSQKQELYNDKGQITKVISKPYTVSGLCLYLGITRETLNQYEDNNDYSDTIKRAKMRIENDVEEGIMTGRINTISGIFNLKNNFGWKDKQEIQQEVNGAVGLNIIIGNQVVNKEENK